MGFLSFIKQQSNGESTKVSDTVKPDQVKLEARLVELEGERKVIQQQIDAANAAAELADRLGNEATRRHDLEGDDSAAPLIAQYRTEKANAQAEVMRLQAIRDSIPARVAAIKLEIEHVKHRQDLQLLAELKRVEQESFLKYEREAIALIDANYAFNLKRWERQQVAERVRSFAASHGLPAPSMGDFQPPVIESFWNQPNLYDQVRRLFSDAKKGFADAG